MADKATLLQDLPPVSKGASTSNPAQAGPGSGTEVQPDQGISISSFQAVTYGSFVLTFILAGFAAIVLYRKAIGDIEPRIVRSAKILAGVLAVTAMHGFVATYLYTNYLRDQSDSAPISLTVLIWIILGATTAYISNRLIELKDKVKKSDAVIDGVFYTAIFVSVTLAVSPKIGANVALILSLLAIILCVVPFSRFFTACKRIKFNRRGSKRKPGRSILYTLVSLPSLVPLFAILYVVEVLGPNATLFFFNAVTLVLIFYISFAMLVRMRNALEGEAVECGKVAEATSATTATQASEPDPVPAMDPLIAELLAEEAASQKEQPSAPPPPAEVPEVVPPAKPAQAGAKKEPAKQTEATAKKKPQKPAAPPKPKPKSGDQAAKDSTLKVKPPTKPKKRF